MHCVSSRFFARALASMGINLGKKTRIAENREFNPTEAWRSLFFLIWISSPKIFFLQKLEEILTAMASRSRVTPPYRPGSTPSDGRVDFLVGLLVDKVLERRSNLKQGVKELFKKHGSTHGCRHPSHKPVPCRSL